MLPFISRYSGIIIGSLYGLAFRLFLGDVWESDHAFTSLFSITFVWVLPILIGISPLVFATKEQLSSNAYRLGSPVLTVFIFFLFCFISGLEDLICIIIISIPFLIGAAIGGLILSEIILHHRKKKGIMYSLFLIPLLTGLLEERFPTPTKVYEIRTPVRIYAPPAKVWENVIRVKEIGKEEYSKGFFHYAGIPRPLFAELDKDTMGATRIGHFEGGLTFREKVTEWQRNQKISLSIEVIPDSARNRVFERHVLKGNHFKFLHASYELKPLNDKETELTLVCSYQLDTKVNGYGSFWGDRLLTDFQERLLAVIKKRCDE